MAGFDYGRMQATATRLLGRFQQGVVTMSQVVPGVVDPDQPWTPAEPTITTHALLATVRRVEQKYVDGTLIVGTEDQITFAVPSVEPEMGFLFSIDGNACVLKDLRRIPAAGTPVAYIAFVETGGPASPAPEPPEASDDDYTAWLVAA